jgi:hypothetical protein
MNYIKRLQEENKGLKANIENAETVIQDMQRYLNSNKFRCGDELDQYININDILTRLNEVKAELERVR